MNENKIKGCLRSQHLYDILINKITDEKKQLEFASMYKKYFLSNDEMNEEEFKKCIDVFISKTFITEVVNDKTYRMDVSLYMVYLWHDEGDRNELLALLGSSFYPDKVIADYFLSQNIPGAKLITMTPLGVVTITTRNTFVAIILFIIFIVLSIVVFGIISGIIIIGYMIFGYILYRRYRSKKSIWLILYYITLGPILYVFYTP